jgi:hypothetical protein
MSGRPLQLPLLLSLLVGSKAAVVGVTGAGGIERDRVPIARREPLHRAAGSVEVLVGATGEAVRTDVIATQGNGSAATEASSAGLPTDHAEPLGDTDMCNFDYVEGVANGVKCSDEQRHTLILDSGVCLFAAEVTGHPVMPMDTFLIAHADYNSHPRGCFRKPCTTGNATDCYFFNGNNDATRLHMAGTNGTTIAGTPVCTRDKYTNGTVDGMDCNLPSVYSLISNDTECSSAAECLGYRQGSVFKILKDLPVYPFTPGDHRSLPHGCFINTPDQEVYYNEYDSTSATPTHPKGTPICRSSTAL